MNNNNIESLKSQIQSQTALDKGFFPSQTQTATRIFNEILRLDRRYPNVYATQNHFAKVAGVHLNTSHLTIKALEENGRIIKIARPFTSCIYRIVEKEKEIPLVNRVQELSQKEEFSLNREASRLVFWEDDYRESQKDDIFREAEFYYMKDILKLYQRRE